MIRRLLHRVGFVYLFGRLLSKRQMFDVYWECTMNPSEDEFERMWRGR